MAVLDRLGRRLMRELGERLSGPAQPGRRFPRAATFEVHPLGPERQVVIDALTLGATKHMMHGVLEVDVTEARRRMRVLPGRLSFTAYVIACVARAIAEHPVVHEYVDPLGRVVRFARVDVNTLVEVERDGRRFPVAHVVRGADRRSVEDLTEEIRDVQVRRPDHPAGERPSWIRRFTSLPVGVRRPVYRWVLSHPSWLQQLTGTVTVSALGMIASGGGPTFAIGPPSVHNLQVIVGSVFVREGRERVHLTLSFNHDLVDGAPATRFATTLRGLLEDGRLMGDLTHEEAEADAIVERPGGVAAEPLVEAIAEALAEELRGEPG